MIGGANERKAKKWDIQAPVAWWLGLLAGIAQAAPSVAAPNTYVVVVPAQPTVEETTSANWLAELLTQSLGDKVAVVRENAEKLPKTCLFVGATRAASAAGASVQSLLPEQWLIKPIGPSLLLMGGRPRGTIYAVTEYLESEMGILMLDPFTEVVPNHPALILPKAERGGRPAFRVRALFTGFPYTSPAQGGRLIEKYRVWNKNVIDGRVAVGDHVRMIPSGVHTFGNFLSAKEFGANHPEYFGMDANGKRVTDDQGTPSAWTQLCVTNADVRRITLERAKQFLRQDRKQASEEGREAAKWLSLSQNDNTSNLCLCKKCKEIADREGSESGPLLDFVNTVARGLKEEFPEVLVQTEAYNFTLQAPKTIRPDANVVVRFCDNYGRSDLTHPLSHPRNQPMQKLFDDWRSTGCKLGVWDYWRLFQQHPPGFFVPSTNVNALAADLRMFQRSGVELMTVEVEDLFGAGVNNDPTSADLQSFMPLRTWVGLKLLDDPNKDVEKLVGTFCQGYYGSAAEPMRNLLESIERRQKELSVRVVDVPRHVWAAKLGSPSFFADAFGWLDEAMKATAQDSAQQTHVCRERIVVDAAFLWMEEYVRRSDPGRAFPTRADLLRRQREDWTRYLATVFNTDGLKLAQPIIATGLALSEKLKPADTTFEHLPLRIADADVQLDGQLTEPFWLQAEPARLYPRNPDLPNDNPTVIRLAWSEQALYVGVEQPVDHASAILGISLMAADRKGIQLSLYSVKHHGPQALNAYFYGYDANGGLYVVKDRKAKSQAVGAISPNHVATELRFLWADVGESPATKKNFLFNIESYPKLDAKVPSHTSSPWLIGSAPTWNSDYFRAMRLVTKPR